MIRFLKTRNVASPEREAGNAGFDFFVPEFTDEFKSDCHKEAQKNIKAGVIFDNDEDGEFIRLDAGKRVSIPSGIKSRIELGIPLSSYGLGIDLVVENKSGIATKKGLDIGACEVDENYQGEIHLSITNASTETVKIRAGDKIVQLVPRVYVTNEAHTYEKDEITEEEFWKDFPWSNRGSGWAGSTSDRPRSEAIK